MQTCKLKKAKAGKRVRTLAIMDGRGGNGWDGDGIARDGRLCDEIVLCGMGWDGTCCMIWDGMG